MNEDALEPWHTAGRRLLATSGRAAQLLLAISCKAAIAARLQWTPGSAAIEGLMEAYRCCGGVR